MFRDFDRQCIPGEPHDGDIWGTVCRGFAASGWGDMKPINVFEFVEFGILIQTIRWFPLAHSEGRARELAKWKAEQLASFRDGWLVERKVGIDLINLAIQILNTAVMSDEMFESLRKMAAKGQWDKPIEEVDWAHEFKTASSYLNQLLTVLEHECPKWPVLSVVPLRAYDTTILLNAAERALSDSACGRLSAHWLEGWREAGRCLAFNAPTAATYQLLRVTEGVIKKYRKGVTGQDAADADGLSEHIDALKPLVAGTVTAALRALKNAHRNPTMHPGKNATMDEAVALFGLCTSVIDSIAADMLSRERAQASATAAATTP